MPNKNVSKKQLLDFIEKEEKFAITAFFYRSSTR